ncbi:MAG TPA: CinA family nicotinamide mononucleotide deamidase-related protein [Thermoanaerobaculia bacterium]|nr:CinA family nicotinamide mononucleotide deamidase-related protein [Thermoanaerobaculia bacterium]
MEAVILAVGTELLGSDRLDTNSLVLTAALEARGWRLARKCAVADDLRSISLELARAAEDADLILVSGGLGPTRDDLTREAVAAFAQRRLVLDRTVLETIEQRYRSFGHVMPETNRKQAEVIEGARVLPNPAGTAPGLHLNVETAGARRVDLFLFPGVPRELWVLTREALEPWLDAHEGSLPRRRQLELKVACLPESLVEERIAPVYDMLGHDQVSVLASPGDIRIRLRPPAAAGDAGDAADATDQALGNALDRAVEAVRAGVGDALYSERGEDLEKVVLDLLVANERSLSVAESCTGGLVAERLTAIPGSSAAFVGGGIVYSNALKSTMLGVDEAAIESHGAVSREVAIAMARGAVRRFGSDLAIAVTGVAGPGGGSDEKPVGTVHLALATSDGAHWLGVRFPGDRERIRRQASQLALEMVRRRLLGLPVESYWQSSAPGEAER